MADTKNYDLIKAYQSVKPKENKESKEKARRVSGKSGNEAPKVTAEQLARDRSKSFAEVANDVLKEFNE